MNAEKETKKIIEFIKDYYKKNNLGGIVVGISGGKDSAVVAALFTKALGKENVLGVTMPCHSNDQDKKDAEKVRKKYGFEMINIDLTETFDTFKKQINNLDNYQKTENSDINLKPRLRMSTLYYLAALYSNIKHKTYLVAGTGNKSEIYVGYFTKGGDGMSDINVLSDYTVSEVIQIGKYLKVPDEVLLKEPSDGLGKQTDEEKLGVTYDDIEKYINKKDIPKKTKEKIRKLHNKNTHKRKIITIKR